MPDRPKSVVVVAAFLFFATVAAIFVGASLLFPNRLMYRLWELNSPGETVFVSIGGPASLFLIALGITTCAAGLGLLRGKRWAWWFAVLLFAVDAFGDIVSFFVTRELLRTVVGVAVSGVFATLLLQGRVRRFFFSKGAREGYTQRMLRALR
jgi:hypothetical protein